MIMDIILIGNYSMKDYLCKNYYINIAFYFTFFLVLFTQMKQVLVKIIHIFLKSNLQQIL